MGQRRVSETLMGTSDASEILDMRPANVAKALERGLQKVIFRAQDIPADLPAAIQKRLQNLEIEIMVDDKGRVRTQMLLIGDKAQRGYSRDWVETIQRQRAADTSARAVDAKRRAAARARTGAAVT